MHKFFRVVEYISETPAYSHPYLIFVTCVNTLVWGKYMQETPDTPSPLVRGLAIKIDTVLVWFGHPFRTKVFTQKKNLNT